MATDAARIRERILDAAAETMIAGGFGTDRLLSAIARRAGLSRPTLYKYGGSVEDIRNALIQRELHKFLERALLPRLTDLDWTAEDVTELLVFVVTFARAHPLLNAARRFTPDQINGAFVTNAGPAIAAVAAVTEPFLRQRIERDALPDLDPKYVIDFLSRLAISLTFTDGMIDLADQDALRRYVRTALAINASLGSTAPVAT